MRRGFEFENELNRVGEYLASIGIHMHKNHARRAINGKFLEGEPFDYEVISHGHFHCFDAKECSSKSWSLKNAKLNQINSLCMCQNNGAEAYFLVWFKLSNKIIRFDVQKVKDALSNGQKSLSPDEGEVWEWTELQK